MPAGAAATAAVNTSAVSRQKRYISTRVLRRLACSSAPQYRAMSTLAPIPNPMHMKWNRLWTWAAMELAERAVSSNCPSITVSIILTPTVMICWAEMGPPRSKIFR